MELNKIYNESNLDTMARMPDGFVDLTVTSPPYDCYSDDTEILTENGWKFIKDVKIGERVMSLNPNTKEIFYQKVINTFKYDYDGELISFKNQNIDLLVTQNHKMYVEYKDGTACRERKPFIEKRYLKSSFLKNADDIKKSDLLRLGRFIWKGKYRKYFILPKLECMFNKKNTVFNERLIIMEDWCYFLGIYLAEGSSRGTKGGEKDRHEVNIKQKDGKSNDQIKRLMDRLPFKYRIYYDKKRKINTYSIVNKQLHDYLYKLGNSHQKYIPNDILSLNKKYLKILLSGYLLGDGTKSKRKSEIGNFSCARCYSENLRNSIIELCLKIGICCRSNNYSNYCVFPTSKYIKLKYCKKNINYIGAVVCVQVKKHNIVYVKRNGKAVFCGNSLRDYKGYSFPFEDIAKELFRVTKEGGVVVWVVGDETKNGSESLTSFKHAIYFVDQCGFNLHDTMIYRKINYVPLTHNRYEQSFEYIFILSKGKPKTFNPIMIPCKGAGKVEKYGLERRQNHGAKHSMRLYKKTEFKSINETKIAPNIFSYTLGKEKTGHPAPFPEGLANDQIISWSNEGDLVYDCFAGSGTTLKMAHMQKRKWIGSEISSEYVELANKRLKPYLTQTQLF